jgi:probable rRNA maturation factor
VIEVDVLGEGLLAPGAPGPGEVRRLCVLVTAAAGIEDGHLAIEYVGSLRIAELNLEHRGRRGPTDVLSFPIDGISAQGEAPRELGDVVICPAHTADLREAIVHGVLHLLGMDHETDDGEMLMLQARLLERASSWS